MNTIQSDGEQEYLAEHTKHMRNALKLCEALLPDAFEKIDQLPGNMISAISDDPDKMREKALHWFSQERALSHSIPVLHVNRMTSFEFRRKFQMGNIPCLINGLDFEEFHSISCRWTSNGVINKNWFIDFVGEETMVPVRKQVVGIIDAEGRAQECETILTPLKVWLASSRLQPDLYLKDWHLVRELQKRRNDADEELYKVPDIFERDVLNSFLSRVTDGDYKFTYWGSKGSCTPLHSDVLDSFSWSYNVLGHKRWKFYKPGNDVPIFVEQRTGECIFVPSGWQHEVTNLVETISINQNWVTTANLDLFYNCIIREMKAVERECAEWKIVSFDARESMLRGCAGFDVTSCFFLLMTTLLECLVNPIDSKMIAFDVKQTVKLIKLLLGDETLNLEDRLSAVLSSEELKQRALEMAQSLISKLVFNNI